MAPPISTSSLLTPIEPERGARRPAASRVNAAGEAFYATPSGRLAAAAASSRGPNHDVNEDTHSDLGGGGRLFVVADGVGGGAMAKLASRLLVAHLHDALAGCTPDAMSVAAAMLAADRVVAAEIARVTELPGAATVALCAPLDPAAASWLIAWVGDCRVYRWSPAARRFDCLTRDDSFGELGEAPPPGGSADDPARMVGNGATHGANCALHTLAPRELLAVCSDGVHKHLGAEDWRALLAEPRPLAQRCQALVARARANGSGDDATLLLVERQARDRQRSAVAGTSAP